MARPHREDFGGGGLFFAHGAGPTEDVRGVVHLVQGGVYTVALEGGTIVRASLRGRLKLEERTGDQVVIGDRVRVDRLDEETYAIEEVLPRETSITRTRFGGRSTKVLVANADRLLAVFASSRPKPRRDLIDRLLVVAEHGGVTPAVVVNKIDLEGAAAVMEGIRGVYEPLGYDVLGVSAETGVGLDRLAEQVCHGIAVLAGPSGVGKSSLVNALEPEQALRTGELSSKRGTGRHTTVASRLIPLRCGGLVADTPGFSDVGVWGARRGDLDQCFPELRPLVADCRFRGCSHLHEPDCAVRAAVEDGRIDAGRFESYRSLYEEAEP